MLLEQQIGNKETNFFVSRAKREGKNITDKDRSNTREGRRRRRRERE